MAEEGKRSECSVYRLMRNEKYYIENISDCSHWQCFFFSLGIQAIVQLRA